MNLNQDVKQKNMAQPNNEVQTGLVEEEVTKNLKEANNSKP